MSCAGLLQNAPSLLSPDAEKFEKLSPVCCGSDTPNGEDAFSRSPTDHSVPPHGLQPSSIAEFQSSSVSGETASVEETSQAPIPPSSHANKPPPLPPKTRIPVARVAPTIHAPPVPPRPHPLALAAARLGAMTPDGFVELSEIARTPHAAPPPLPPRNDSLGGAIMFPLRLPSASSPLDSANHVHSYAEGQAGTPPPSAASIDGRQPSSQGDLWPAALPEE